MTPPVGRVRHGISVPVIRVQDLVETRFGMSLYRGVIVCWDSDRDARILDFIDSLDEEHRSHLAAAHEERGNLYLAWLYMVPETYRDGTEVTVESRFMYGTEFQTACDHWHVTDSVVIDGPR